LFIQQIQNHSQIFKSKNRYSQGTLEFLFGIIIKVGELIFLCYKMSEFKEIVNEQEKEIVTNETMNEIVTANESKEIVVNEYIVKMIYVEGLNVPLRVKRDILDIGDILNYKINMSNNYFSKEKMYHNQVLDRWVKSYDIDKDFIFDISFTGIVKNGEGCKIFLLYFKEQEEENFYVEISITFSKNVEHVNEIFLLILNK